ncbi:UNVERIFIED_CONTAM: Agamous-like MADS-box protein [Sesamum angustifolium]|uniref:Agamous-like MADS-box protein n=1 Tax=Sesamum angustifolium TaxID=2727405 RepID=A0AAW2LJ68_9LAMI
MGRVKLKIQRLESLSSRQVTYGKRRAGILKKAQEISVLCDIDIILLMFSPTGKPSIFRGQRSNLDEMIAKYSQLTPKERAKRRLESLETLKRNFKKLDQDVDIEEFLDTSMPSTEEMHSRVNMMQAQLSEVRKRLSWWTNPDKIEDIEHLNQMEYSLRESLNRTHMHKQEKFLKDPLISFDCTSQFQNGMHLPIVTTSDQDCQTQSWLPGGESQHMILPNEPHFLASRDMDCSRDASFPTCSGYFGDMKEQDLDNSREMKNERQGGISVEDYACSAPLRLPLVEQYPYHSFANLSFPDLLEPGRETNFQPSTMDYQITGNFELPRSVYNSLPHSLVPTVGSCVISMLNGHSYQQVSLSQYDHLLSCESAS